MRKAILYTSVICGVFSISVLIARSFRVDKIPNGSINTCSNCHIDPNGGGTRNAFGKEVEKHVTPNGTQDFWNQTLASLDSDGDGFTNGEELQDPTGSWRPGQSAPGDPSMVTNPGDPSSHPITASVDDSGLPYKFALMNNYPNPFNPTTTIRFQLAEPSRVLLTIYNGLGQEIRTLAQGEYSSGSYSVIWDGKNNYGQNMASGMYIYRLATDKYVFSKQMILMK